MIRDYFSIAYEGIKHRKLRSWLTMLGIFIGIASIVSLFSLGQGLQVAIDKQFQEIGANKLIIQGGSSHSFSTAFSSTELTEDDAEQVKRVNGVKSISFLNMGTPRVKYNDKTLFLFSHGIPLDDKLDLVLESESIKMREGRTLKVGDEHKVMIGYDLAESDIAFGKKVRLHDRISVEDVEFEVVGILESQGNKVEDRIIWLPIKESRQLFGYSEKKVDFIYAETSKGYEPSVVAESVKEKLRRYRNVKEGEEDFQVTTFEKIIESFKGVFAIVQLVVLGITSIALIIGSIGILNTMFTAVIERTSEIGIMKAVGARNSTIMALFIFESGILGLFGGAIGVILGASFSKVVEYVGTSYFGSELIKAYFPWYLILGTMAFSFVIGGIAGAFPAYKASRLQPVEALRGK